MSFRIVLDQQRCIGAENCARLAPRTFDTEDGKVFVQPDSHDDLRVVEIAAAACPMQAIRIEAINGVPTHES